MQSAPASVLENLSRLASKPGVKSTLILSKSDGAIIRSSGLRSVNLQVSPALPESYTLSDQEGNSASTTAIHAPNYADGSEAQSNERSAEDIARAVFAFVMSAGTLAQGIETGDEVQLLRLRTRRNDIVIVPDARYLLVVIHDPPRAT